MNGFTDEQIMEIRSGSALFNAKYHVLAKFVREVTVNRGKPTDESTNDFFAAGYNNANLIDVVILIGEITISNLLYGVTQFPIDFPLAPELEGSMAN
jgi:alkylhydroperoxidase family enzyme